MFRFFKLEQYWYNAYRLLRKKARKEKQVRLKYQKLVYDLCSVFDKFEGRHISRGTGTTIDELVPKTTKALRVLRHEGILHEARLEEGKTRQGKFNTETD